MRREMCVEKYENKLYGLIFPYLTYFIFECNTYLCKNILLSTGEPGESFCLPLTPSISLCSAENSSKPTSSINPSQIDQKEINDFSWTQFILTLKSKFHSPWSSTLAKIWFLSNLQMIRTKYEWVFLSLYASGSIIIALCKFFFSIPPQLYQNLWKSRIFRQKIQLYVTKLYQFIDKTKALLYIRNWSSYWEYKI